MTGIFQAFQEWLGTFENMSQMQLPTSDSGLTRNSLLSRARQQDSVAWGELVDLYGPLIAHWCRQYKLDSHSTADCVQEVFAAVSRGLAQYVPKHASGAFRAWLWTITRNKLTDTARARRNQANATGGSSANQALQQVVDPSELPDSEPDNAEQTTELVQRAMAQVEADFEPRTWNIFRRSVIDQIETTLVAREFEITPATVRQVRSRILRRIRQQMGDIVN